ncbi:hypothetical protein GCM10020295_36000 [Streptomyces cinereospinus]
MTSTTSRARAVRRRRLWAAARRAGWKGVLLTPGLGAARGTHDTPSSRAPHWPTDPIPDERKPS